MHTHTFPHKHKCEDACSQECLWHFNKIWIPAISLWLSNRNFQGHFNLEKKREQPFGDPFKTVPFLI